MKKRSNPYNIEDVMKKHNLSGDEAIQKINDLKIRTSGSIKSFINRYGEKDGKIKYDEFCKKSANTLDKFISKYGEKDGKIKYDIYLKSKDSVSLKHHIKKYGEEIGKIKYDVRLKSLSNSLENLIEKYGEEVGKIKYTEMIKKKSYKCSTTGLIEKYGYEHTMKINKSKSNPGKNNGMYGKLGPIGSGNGWSGWYKGIHFRSILELSYMKYLNDNNIEFKSAETKDLEVKYIFNGNDRTYRADFNVNGVIIEIKPKNLIKSKQNVAKFEAARRRFGNNFKVLTEDDFERIKNIAPLIECGDVKLTKRYKEKYENNKH